jgi:hypothetical protein
MNPIAPDMRTRYDELVACSASIELWSEFRTILDGAVRQRQVIVLAIKRGFEIEATTVSPDVLADFRALDALRREVVATIESMRSRKTRELQPVSKPSDDAR